jgi:hypothetical protein
MPVAVFELEVIDKLEAMRAKPTCAFNINEYDMGLPLNNVLVNEINSALTYLCPIREL